MRRTRPGGYELDDDRDRVDVDALHRFLSEEYRVGGALGRRSSVWYAGRHACQV